VENATIGKTRGFFTARIATLAALAGSSIIGTVIFTLTQDHPADNFRYYTTLSNVVLAIVCIADIHLLLRKRETGKLFALARLSAVIAILLTGIVYSLFLAPSVRFNGWRTLGNFLLHYFSPFAAPVAWLVFAEKGRVGFRQAWAWLAFPLLYVAYALIQGGLIGFYPYWFLNPSKPRPAGIGSYSGVLIFVAAVSACFLVLGSLLVLADKTLAKKGARASAPGGNA
jgi:hypothetical protein